MNKELVVYALFSKVMVHQKIDVFLPFETSSRSLGISRNRLR